MEETLEIHNILETLQAYMASFSSHFYGDQSITLMVKWLLDLLMILLVTMQLPIRTTMPLALA